MNPFVKYPVILLSRITNAGTSVYRNDFDDCAETYDDVVTRPILARATEKLLESCGPSIGDRCIDCGCGTGHATELIARRIGTTGSVIACDFSEMMIEKAKARLAAFDSVSFRSGDMLRSLDECGEQAFDFAGLFWSLEYVDPSALLAKLGRVMKKGGRVAVLVNTRASLTELQDLIAPILIRNILCLKKIPPLNFLSSTAQFERIAKRTGFTAEHIAEETATVTFPNGRELVSWMNNGGPSAGFKSSIRKAKREKIFGLIAKEVDRRGGLSVGFRYVSYSGIKQ
ncbi:methyltransferase domain-containing protein [bacterium]|nr:methyltransferase domain-containing protein [bacterium]